MAHDLEVQEEEDKIQNVGAGDAEEEDNGGLPVLPDDSQVEDIQPITLAEHGNDSYHRVLVVHLPRP